MKKLTHDQVLVKFKSKHGDRYDYSRMVYINYLSEVEIICPIHGSFWQIPSNHIKGCGCYPCGKSRAGTTKKDTTQSAINRFKSIHHDKYDYSKVNYVNNLTKIEIVCPQHGSFWQTPGNHGAGKGCRGCQNNKLSADRTRDTADVINGFVEIHNQKYDYSRIEYVNRQTPVEIICPDHGVFWQSPSNHTKGKGCPRCSHRVSKPGSAWLDSLNIPTLIREYKLPENKRRPVDGYDPNTNTIYQFHGDYWHGNPSKYLPTELNKTCGITFGELYQSTLSVEQQLRDYGYNLVIMWEGVWKASLLNTNA